MSDPLLERLLALAEQEGALGPGRLEAFARGLRERAALILEERVEALERESRWLRENRDAASAAHDRLLDHHRRLLAQVVDALSSVAGHLRRGPARQEIEALVASLKRELP